VYTLPVKIAIDIRRIGDFGVGTYIRNVLRALGRLDQENTYILIGPREKFRDIDPLPSNFEGVALTAPEASLAGFLGFRRILRHEHCQLVHIPHLSWMPQSLPCPYVITVHDVLEHMSRLRDHSGLRRAAHFHLTRRVLQRAARIFAVSNFTKQDVEALFRIPSHKIEVVYNAIDERFRLGHATDADRQFIAERYQVNYPFLLYAGRISPHKNVGRIIEAFSALKAELEKEGKLPDLKLIIIGDELSRQPELRRTVVRSAVQNDVRFLGFVPIEVLRIFYDTAKIFVFPSLYEGFGLGPLEAMSHGTPVVTSNTTSLPEVVGNAAVLVNPENVFEIMRALHRVLLDQALRDKLKQRGYEQGARFSWEASARRVLQGYREVTGGNWRQQPPPPADQPVAAIRQEPPR
ncbi:MAG TPA: glycosyltransferase family 1 protein, partial [Terriglobales bacterium]|nr:glycosyltransferase family 1 protein [Terriglobales bacterium]